MESSAATCSAAVCSCCISCTPECFFVLVKRGPREWWITSSDAMYCWLRSGCMSPNRITYCPASVKNCTHKSPVLLLECQIPEISAKNHSHKLDKVKIGHLITKTSPIAVYLRECSSIGILEREGPMPKSRIFYYCELNLPAKSAASSTFILLQEFTKCI